jgi:hypothetical protein
MKLAELTPLTVRGPLDFADHSETERKSFELAAACVPLLAKPLRAGFRESRQQESLGSGSMI